MTDILLVDDATSRKELRSLLSNGPYNYLSVCEAGSVQRGLSLLREERPDIVVTDLSLPDGDGMQFGRKVLECSPGTYVVVTSNLQMFDTVYEAINEGFSAYLLKPIMKSELCRVLERIVRLNLLKSATGHIGTTGPSHVSKVEVDLGNPIDSVISYIDGHYSEPISLQDVAERVYLSPSYFSRLFKAEIGVTFTEYLTAFRIQKSKLLLRFTSLPVEVVAANTGFTNASYFSTTFKRSEGRTPTEYRGLFSWVHPSDSK